MKIAVISNINIDGIVRLIPNKYDVFENVGYGNIFESICNPNSNINLFNPDILFILNDIDEMLVKDISWLISYKNIIDGWFERFENFKNNNIIYFISNADFSYEHITVLNDSCNYLDIEQYWNYKLKDLVNKNSNIFIFNLKSICEKIGKNSFYSVKLWYLGGVKYTNGANKLIAEDLSRYIELTKNNTKKVLILDLDNTIWGGIVGEDGIENIKISDSGVGRIYKDFQRLIKEIQQTGVILAIVSKNNLTDVKEVFDNISHMILKWDDFVLKKVNWENKANNIIEIAKELSLGLDSMVFIDDNPSERKIIIDMLPEVVVPEFPVQLEKLLEFMRSIFNDFFMKLELTNEDRNKTLIYKENINRKKLEKSMDFSSYLKTLDCRVTRVESIQNHIQRIDQLINKTNQFNLTTIRLNQSQIIEIINQKNYFFYLFSSTDCFGDNGIIALVIVKITENVPTIELFTLSCRVMGRLIENYIIDYVERDLINNNFKSINSWYYYTTKSKPVLNFYEGLGYKLINDDSIRKSYICNLLERKERKYLINGEEFI